jgi:HEAT repeats/Peptidase S24-like
MDADGLERALAERGCACLRVAGGSMSPTVAEGGEVMVRRGRASLGDVVVLRARGELIVHRLVARLGPRWVHKGDREGALPGLCRDDEVLGLAELPREPPSPSRRLRWALMALSRALLLLALVGVVAGCKKAPPPPAAPVVVDVRVEDRTPQTGELPRADVAALAKKAAEAIGASGLPVVDGGAGGASFKLRVQVRLDGGEDAAAKKGVLRAFVEAKLVPVGAAPDALGFEQAAVAEHTYNVGELGDREVAFRAHALRAVEEVVRGLGARAKLARSGPTELLAALRGSDEDLQEEAVRLAGERKEPQAVPPLLDMLKSEDPAVRDRAIGALAAIGDRRAVHPLTEVAHFRELSELPKILDALAAIGGEEAQSYLEFVASGHDSPEMRDLAKQALEHLAERAKK